MMLKLKEAQLVTKHSKQKPKTESKQSSQNRPPREDRKTPINKFQVLIVNIIYTPAPMRNATLKNKIECEKFPLFEEAAMSVSCASQPSAPTSNSIINAQER